VVRGLPPARANGFCRAQRQLDCSFDQPNYEPLPQRGTLAAASAATDTDADHAVAAGADAFGGASGSSTGAGGSTISRRPGYRRLLVLVAGVTERFYPIPTLRYVVAPAVRAGYTVDYYAVLSMDATGGQAFRAYWYAPVGNPEFANYTAQDLETYIIRRAWFYGASRAGVMLLPNEVELDVLPSHVFANQRLLVAEKNGIRESTGKFDASDTFWLFLMKMKKVELLWNWTVGNRMDRSYDHVVWTRSDAYWVDDLKMEHFPDHARVYSRPWGNLCSKPFGERAINDQTFVLGGCTERGMWRAGSSRATVPSSSTKTRCWTEWEAPKTFCSG